MASALLASSRNEPFWGEQKVYMRKNPNPNPRPAPNNPGRDRPRAASASSPFVDRLGLAAGADEPPPAAYAATPAVSDDSSSFNHHKPSGQHYHHRPSRKDSSFGAEYVTFNIAACSRRELQELKRRLISELDQVRSLSSRIEAGDVQIARSACFSASSYGGGGGGGGREVTSAASAGRPPSLPLNQSLALDSPPLLTGLERRAPTGGNHYLQLPLESVSGRDSVGGPFHAGDNHKKLSKRTLPLTSSREAKRQATTAESEKLLAGMMKKCGQILTKLMKHRHGWVFNSPVDVVGMGLDDYHAIIQRPMDLGTVKSQLEKDLYSSPMQFADDIRLTFTNALRYNPEGHDVHKMAGQLLNLFEKLFADACRSYDKQKRAQAKSGDVEEKKKGSSKSHAPVPSEALGRASPAPANLLPAPSPAPVVPLLPASPAVRSPSPVTRPPPQTVVPPSKPQPTPQPVLSRPSTGKQPKPKAKDPNKREMSFEEKQKLSMGLQSLPQEKMAQVVQIVQRRNPHPALHDDEIELDFEVLDTETLWELDRFVCNCKKMLSKLKRNAAAPATVETKVDNIDKTQNQAQAETSEHAYEKKGKKAGEPGDEDVDIGEDMPSSHFPPVEIEKDTGYHSETSSSSSSSSGSSSSSDSDSRSSSDSDSDADDAQSPAVG